MPTSAKTFDKEVNNLIRSYLEKRMYSYLDIGAGQGKYGKMIRHIVNELKETQVVVSAIEINLGYIADYDLADIYNYVFHGSVQSFMIGDPTFCANVVIMGDILEHMRKSDGIDLIEFFMHRCNYIIIVVPEKLVQLNDKHKNECHNSIWDQSIFEMYRGTIRKKHDKILATIPGYFNYASARTDSETFDIMKKNKCDRFKGEIIYRG